jgi:hypothetical protein
MDDAIGEAHAKQRRPGIEQPPAERIEQSSRIVEPPPVAQQPFGDPKEPPPRGCAEHVEQFRTPHRHPRRGAALARHRLPAPMLPVSSRCQTLTRRKRSSNTVLELRIALVLSSEPDPDGPEFDNMGRRDPVRDRVARPEGLGPQGGAHAGLGVERRMFAGEGARRASAPGMPGRRCAGGDGDRTGSSRRWRQTKARATRRRVGGKGLATGALGRAAARGLSRVGRSASSSSTERALGNSVKTWRR